MAVKMGVKKDLGEEGLYFTSIDKKPKTLSVDKEQICLRKYLCIGKYYGTQLLIF